MANDEEKARVDARLRDLLAGLHADRPGADQRSTADRIKAATADEIFDLIDEDL